MTKQQPQQEYIITEEQVKLMEAEGLVISASEIRSRPLVAHTSSTEAPTFEKTIHPTIHRVKCWTPYFQAMKRGDKLFEKRIWDRDYQVGDILIQEEWNPNTGYTGDSIGRIIKYILEGEFAEKGICLMSVDGIEFETRQEHDAAIRNATLKGW